MRGCSLLHATSACQAVWMKPDLVAGEGRRRPARRLPALASLLADHSPLLARPAGRQAAGNWRPGFSQQLCNEPGLDWHARQVSCSGGGADLRGS